MSLPTFRIFEISEQTPDGARHVCEVNDYRGKWAIAKIRREQPSLGLLMAKPIGLPGLSTAK